MSNTETMSHKCSECASTFHEKKNLHHHLRKDHGLKKYKCDLCAFRANDLTSLRKHEKAKHENIVLECKQCEYKTQDGSNLNRHIRSKHVKKNIKCEQCNFETDRNDMMKRHVKAMHTLKTCNECEFSTKSIREMKIHKRTQHEPDESEVNSAMNNLFYEKTWKVRGLKDPLSTLQVYKGKIRNTMIHYLKTKGAMKWYIGMKVRMYRPTGNGTVQEASPGFSSTPKLSPHMWNFENLYKEAQDKIMNDFVEFNANGSGWILERVELITIHIAGYQPVRLNQREQEEIDNDDREAERMQYDV